MNEKLEGMDIEYYYSDDEDRIMFKGKFVRFEKGGILIEPALKEYEHYLFIPYRRITELWFIKNSGGKHEKNKIQS